MALASAQGANGMFLQHVQLIRSCHAWGALAAAGGQVTPTWKMLGLLPPWGLWLLPERRWGFSTVT